MNRDLELEEAKKDIRQRGGDPDKVVRFADLTIGAAFRTSMPGPKSKVRTKISDTEAQLPSYEIPALGISQFRPDEFVIIETDP